MNPQDRTFAMVETAAVKRERCPQNHELPKGGSLPKLAREGRIRIQISGHNWRQVVILAGPHKGTRTAPNPQGHGAWQILDARHPRRRYIRDGDELREKEEKRLWSPPQGGE
jgi:hypothetical protein